MYSFIFIFSNDIPRPVQLCANNTLDDEDSYDEIPDRRPLPLPPSPQILRREPLQQKPPMVNELVEQEQPTQERHSYQDAHQSQWISSQQTAEDLTGQHDSGEIFQSRQSQENLPQPQQQITSEPSPTTTTTHIRNHYYHYQQPEPRSTPPSNSSPPAYRSMPPEPTYSPNKGTANGNICKSYPISAHGLDNDSSRQQNKYIIMQTNHNTFHQNQTG